jgi:hypothetical protein
MVSATKPWLKCVTEAPIFMPLTTPCASVKAAPAVDQYTVGATPALAKSKLTLTGFRNTVPSGPKV